MIHYMKFLNKARSVTNIEFSTHMSFTKVQSSDLTTVHYMLSHFCCLEQLVLIFGPTESTSTVKLNAQTICFSNLRINTICGTDFYNQILISGWRSWSQ
jgi:hypothetical protein